jgi:hypothetical protein
LFSSFRHQPGLSAFVMARNIITHIKQQAGLQP